MGIQFSSLMGGMVAIAASMGLGSAAIANPDPFNPAVPVGPRPIGLEQEFERVFFGNDREFFNNRSIPRQLDFIFGIRNSFVENEINRDARNIHELYVEALEQQLSSDPVIRTPDLPSPFNRSLLQIPFSPVNR